MLVPVSLPYTACGSDPFVTVIPDDSRGYSLALFTFLLFGKRDFDDELLDSIDEFAIVCVSLCNPSSESDKSSPIDGAYSFVNEIITFVITSFVLGGGIYPARYLSGWHDL